MKNEKKWIIIGIILLMVIAAGRIMNGNASAREINIEEPEIEAKAEVLAVWMTGNETIRDSIFKIKDIFYEDYNEVKLIDSDWNFDMNRLELTFKTEYGTVMGHIYDDR